MRGIARSIRYWIYNMEKLYGIMTLTIAAVLAFQCITNGIHVLYYMAKMYFPMMGSIFAIAMMMNSANHYIPQSLSSGGTRKEVFVGMQLALHLMICQTLLIVVIYSKVVPFGSLLAEGGFFPGCTAVCLFFAGVGNLVCAGSLRFGTRAGKILYLIFVVGVATVMGLLSILDELGTVSIFKGEYIAYIVAAAAAADLLMMAVCYLAIRRYEVR